MNNYRATIILALIIVLTACGGGQAPEASEVHSRAVIMAGAIVPAEEIRVVEFLQYYAQNLPEPEQDTIGLDLRLGNSRLPVQGGIAWLQMGLQTKSGDVEFVDSLELKQRAVSEVSLIIIPAKGVHLVGLTGLDETPPAEGAKVPLAPMATGDSTILLAQLEVEPARGWTSTRPLAQVQLHYFDELARRPVIEEQTIKAEMVGNLNGYDPAWDLEVLRNVTIQQTAEGMRRIDQLYQAGQYEAAWRMAVELEDQLNEVARLTTDNQLLEDAKLMQRYQQTLADAVWQAEGRQPRLAEPPRPMPSQQHPAESNSGRGPSPTPSVPAVEIR